VDSRGPFFSWSLPWRPPDLARFSRTSEFQELHAAADDWIEQQFTRISANAEALVPAARSVSDYGSVHGTGGAGALNLGILAIRYGVFAYLGFSRQVAVAYGFDGSIPDQISELLEVIEQGGWDIHLNKARAVNGKAAGRWVGADSPPHRTLIAPGWADRPGPHQLPPGLVHVAWTSRTHPSHATLDVGFPANPDTREPWSYLGLEMVEPIAPTDISHFAAPALENHEHAVAVLIELDFYRALPGSTRARDVPRRLVPRGR
jgi:hypothetical protein